MTAKSSEAISNPDLEVITRVILIFGILFVSGGIIYVSTRPEEPDLFFFLLNENQVMRDYPTNTTVGEAVKFYVFIENLLGTSEKFAVRIYNTTEEYWINSTIGVSESNEVSYNFNQTVELNHKEEWISNSMELFFHEPGSNQVIILELWQFSVTGWRYIPDFLLTLRISVYP